MNNGWILLHRKILHNPIAQNPEYFSLFVTLLLMANHQDNYILINNSKFLIKRGQILTSRLKLSQITGIQESKVERILKYLKCEQQIEQQNLVIGRLITIINYDAYQKIEQQNEHGMNSERTAREQLVNTNNNVNNDNKKKLYSHQSDEMRLSTLLLNLITSRRPTFKTPNLQAWAKHVHNMIKLDSRTAQEIEKVIRWCQNDLFWQNNILSTEKLRKQFDRLALKMSPRKESFPI